MDVSDTVSGLEQTRDGHLSIADIVICLSDICLRSEVDTDICLTQVHMFVRHRFIQIRSLPEMDIYLTDSYIRLTVV